MPPLMHVESTHVMRQVDEIGAWCLVGAGVGDVEHGFIARERDPVGLVETVGHHCRLTRREIVAVDKSADLRRVFEVLDLAIVRVGEPHRAVALHHHVVRRVEGKPRHSSTTVSTARVLRSMRLIRATASRAPCSQITSRPSRSSVMPFCHIGGLLHGFEPLRGEGKVISRQLQAHNGDVLRSGLRHCW